MSPEPTLQDYIAAIDQYIDGGHTDGLPVVVPTESSLQTMLSGTKRSPDDVLGEAMWRETPITVRDVAVNAVMAGCKPAYLPAVLAAIEVIAKQGPVWIVSTASFAPLIILNGPVREQLQVNCRMSVMGPGTRANATIGRAVHLCLVNLWQAKVGLYDRATMGSAYRYSWVVGEDEENSPWEPLHVSAGMAAGSSAEFIASSWHPFEINHLEGREPETILGTIADFFSLPSQFNAPYIREDESGFERHGLRAVVFLGEDHRNHIANAGWSKADVSEFLVKNSGRKAGEVRSRGFVGDRLFPRSTSDDAWVPVFDSADDVLVVSAGGPGGHSAVAKITWSDHKMLEL